MQYLACCGLCFDGGRENSGTELRTHRVGQPNRANNVQHGENIDLKHSQNIVDIMVCATIFRLDQYYRNIFPAK